MAEKGRAARADKGVIASAEPVTYKEGPLSFSGTAAVVKKFADGRVNLALLAPGKLSYGTLALEKQGAATAEGTVESLR